MLVVHGIGQAMKRVELGVTQLRSIVECCDMMRNNTDEIDKQQNADDSQRDIGQSTSHAPGEHTLNDQVDPRAVYRHRAGFYSVAESLV